MLKYYCLWTFYCIITLYLSWRIFIRVRVLCDEDIFGRRGRWITNCFRSIILIFFHIYELTFLAQIISGFRPYTTPKWIMFIGNIGMGITFPLFVGIGLLDLLALTIKRQQLKKIILTLFGTAVAVMVAWFGAYGVINAYDVKISHYEVEIDKECKVSDFRIVLLSDVHLGSNISLSDLEKLQSMVNEQNADMVCIVGDIFHSSFGSVASPKRTAEILSGFNSRLGTFACLGNHDEAVYRADRRNRDRIYMDTRADEFIHDSKIRLLEDQTILLDDGIYIVGRRDKEKPATESGIRKTANEMLNELDKEKPIIVLDHIPEELSELDGEGADLTLSGHTHGGQLFPLTLTMIFEDNPHGEKQYKNMTSIVTSGCTTTGPPMRVGSISEIAVVDISFK